MAGLQVLPSPPGGSVSDGGSFAARRAATPVLSVKPMRLGTSYSWFGVVESVVLGLGVVLVACSGSGGAAGGPATGGANAMPSGGNATNNNTGGSAVQASGGMNAAGGTSAVGGSGQGSSSGGAHTGGSSSGGAASGGAITGGSSSGGATSGGSTATGGSETSGGTAGSGGSSVSEAATGGVPSSPYDYGFAPATISADDARAAYDDWAEIHLEDCGSGVYRVRWENAKLDATVSEGIGYGMLLTVSHGDQEAFDGLLAYYKQALNQGSNDQWAPQPATGLMHWLRYGCDAHRALTYSEYPDNAAADADLDVAMALIMADCRWGDSGYASEASRIIGAIREHMFIDHNGKHVLQPGDSTWFDTMGAGCVNYSYFAPAYYREFAAHDSGNSSFWNAAADDAYTLLAAASDSSTGLVRNWGSADGGDATPDCHNAYTQAASYGDDAARTPWRIATDYLWNGTSEAKAWNDRVTEWVNEIGVENTAQWYQLSGEVDTSAPTPEDHTAINVGPWAVGAMTYDQPTVDAFADELASIPSDSGSHDAEYFPRMLRALTLLTLSGGFTPCGGAE